MALWEDWEGCAVWKEGFDCMKCGFGGCVFWTLARGCGY